MPDSAIYVTDVQITAARRSGLQFLWRITMDSGKVIDQFDPITGTEQQFPNWVEWVVKSPLDIYSGTACFKNVRSAAWIPVDSSLSAVVVDRAFDAHSMIIFRKNYVQPSGDKYVAYCVGQRWENGDSPLELVLHITPPTRYDPLDYSLASVASRKGVLFKGGVSEISSPTGQNLFDKFIDRFAKRQ